MSKKTTQTRGGRLIDSDEPERRAKQVEMIRKAPRREVERDGRIFTVIRLPQQNPEFVSLPRDVPATATAKARVEE